MKPSDDKKLIDIVKATGEIYSKQISLAAAVMFLADLEGYDSQLIIQALAKCRKELRTFPTIADVIARIDDGRPGVEEAWSMIPHDEDGSVIWTEEMAEAYGVARSVLVEGDPIAARMAFKESYLKLVANARNSGETVKWTPSFGRSPYYREAATEQAITKKRITVAEAKRFLPSYEPREVRQKLPAARQLSDLMGGKALPSVEDQKRVSGPPESFPHTAEGIRLVKAAMETPKKD